MKTSLYTVIMTKAIQQERNFFVELFDFKETFTSDWYISLISDGFELALIDVTHETIPESYRKECQGVIINIEVDDVDEVYSRIMKRVDSSLLLLDIKSEDFGQRHFIIKSPSDVMVDIIQVVPPTGKYVDNYTKGMLD